MNQKNLFKKMKNLFYNFHDFFHIYNVPTGKSFFFALFFLIGFIFSLIIKKQELIKWTCIGLLLSIIAIYRHFNKYNIWDKFKKK